MLNLDNIFNKFYPKSQTSGTGKKLYIMAWAIEIFIALVGLTMAYIFYKKAGFGSENNAMYFSPLDNVFYSAELLVLKIPVFLFGNLFGLQCKSYPKTILGF